MAKRDASAEQERILKLIRKQFGKTAIGTYRVNADTGVMRVELKCQAGVWHWWYSADGEMIDRALHTKLPETNTQQSEGE